MTTRCHHCETAVGECRAIHLDGMTLCRSCRRELFRSPKAASQYPRLFAQSDETERKRPPKRSRKSGPKTRDIDPWDGEWSPWMEPGDLAAELDVSTRALRSAWKRRGTTRGHTIQRRGLTEDDDPQQPNTQSLYRARKR